MVKVILFGATGMVGQGVLRECLLDSEVERVLSIGRRSSSARHPKLREVLHADFADFSAIERELTGYAACLFCLGVSSAGMSERDYTRVTCGFAIAAAETLARLNQGMTFVYVSGAGTDGSERGRVMWARVKGRTENALLRLPFKAAFMFRPGLIRPVHGVRSGTRLYRVFYAALGPLYPLAKALFPSHLLTTETLGRAMLEAAKRGAPESVLEAPDINRLLADAGPGPMGAGRGAHTGPGR